MGKRITPLKKNGQVSSDKGLNLAHGMISNTII